jgi:choice-of-anchor A domain-containing protein
MKNFTRLIFTALVAFAAPAIAQSPTAPALNFNVFLEKGASLTTNETEGPVAMGGNLTLSGSYQVAAHSAGTFRVGNTPVALVINGKVDYSGGQRVQVLNNGHVKIGDSTGSFVWYKDMNNAYSPIRITPGANYNGSPRIEMSANSQTLGNINASNNPVFEKTTINFSNAFNTFRNSAVAMSQMTDNASLTNPNGQPIAHTSLPSQVKINLNSGINVLNITGTDLNACQIFTYNQRPNANQVLIINVNAPGAFNWNTWNQAGLGFTECPYVLYNFFNTTTLNMVSGSAIEGTVFAPNADIIKNGNQSNIEGQVIAKSFVHGGGEVHYAIFSPSITPTSASFNINLAQQCLTGNSFTFTSTSAGSAPLTYNWNFGDNTTSTIANPTKIYNAAGVYTVTLTVTGALGSNTTSKTVTVSDPVTKGFTVNQSPQALTGNVFNFTTTNAGVTYTYNWDFGDGQTANTVDASHTYAAAGSYAVLQTVTNGACTDTSLVTVIVESDSVCSGNGGGLESESLGDLVSKREFNRTKNSFNPYINYNNLEVFKHTRRLGKKADLKLADIFPQTLEAGDVTRVSTPADLLELTIATEVLGLDYTRNNQAKGVVLGMKTVSRPYNHTKSICDRLRGATLLSVEPVTIKGYQFLQFALRQDNDVVEYAIAFVVGKQNNSTEYTLQSNWLISSYTDHDAFYNMQVWGTLPQYTQKLVGDIIDNVTNGNTLVQTNENTIPGVYVTKGVRNQQNLVLHIVNKTSATTARLYFEETRNEQSGYTDFEVPVTLTPNAITTVEVPVKDGYEYDLGIFVNEQKTDESYLADGNWSLDYDKAYTSIDAFDINNEPNREYTANEYSVYRSVNMAATSSDYVTLYKPVRAGVLKTDLSSYEYLEFSAKGNGRITIRLTREGIINWHAQYKAGVELTENNQVFRIPFSDFKSDEQNTPFVPNDAKMLTFSFENTSGDPKTYEMTLGSVKFGKAATGVNMISTNNISVSAYPNPNKGNFEVAFVSGKSEIAEIEITDLVGRVIFTRTINLYAGQNNIEIDLLSQQAEPKGVMFVNIKGSTQSFTAQKILVK